MWKAKEKGAGAERLLSNLRIFSMSFVVAGRRSRGLPFRESSLKQVSRGRLYDFPVTHLWVNLKCHPDLSDVGDKWLTRNLS